MDEQRKNRIAAAITVNVIILVIILVSVLIYQLVEIVGASRKRDALKAEIEKTQQMIDDKEKDLEYLKSEQYLLDLLFQQGYYFPKK